MYKLLFILSSIITVVNSYSFPQLNILWKNKNVLPLWLPVIKYKNINKVPKLVYIHGEPFTIYKNNNEEIIIIYDKCPHQGASLAAGKIKDNCLVCPYHSFEFEDGNFCRIPKSKKFISNKSVPRLETKIVDDIIYVKPYKDLNNKELDVLKDIRIEIPDPYLPPEHFDKNFRKISGEKTLNLNNEIITENILDMLHISTVHSFGNIDFPLPYNIKFENIDYFSGRTIFQYKSGNYSISKQYAGEVVVHNEYYLPGTTITRVIAGSSIKVVMTTILPVSENKSVLYWSVYRNFWNDYLPELCDMIIEFFMEKTLKEDVNILEKVYNKNRTGNINTKYDITINKYRKAKSIISEYI